MCDETTSNEPLDFGDGPLSLSDAPAPAHDSGADAPASLTLPDRPSPLTAEQVRSMTDTELNTLLAMLSLASRNHVTQRLRAIESEDRLGHLTEQLDWHRAALDETAIERDRAWADRDAMTARCRALDAEVTQTLLALADMQEVCAGLALAVEELKRFAPQSPRLLDLQRLSSRFGSGYKLPARSATFPPDEASPSDPGAPTATSASPSASDAGCVVLPFARRSAPSDAPAQD